MTGCNWVLNGGNLTFIFQVQPWKHLLSHLQVTSPTFPLNVEPKPVSLVAIERMTSLFCVGGFIVAVAEFHCGRKKGSEFLPLLHAGL